MNLDSLTSAELIGHVDNMPTATELERLLANRLDNAMRNLPDRIDELHDRRPAQRRTPTPFQRRL